jgi:hypothetical protein
MSLERIHTPRYLHFLRHAWADWLALDPANAQGRVSVRVACAPLRSDIEPDNFAPSWACIRWTAARR